VRPPTRRIGLHLSGATAGRCGGPDPIDAAADFPNYPAGRTADDLIERDGRKWWNPD